MKRRWPRPRFTILALLVLITLCAPFLAYLSLIRRGNEQRKAAFDDALAKGMRLEPSHTSPASATPKTEAAGARELWSTLLGDPKLPNFARVQIHDFFGKNRPRPPITDRDLASLEYLPEIEEFHFYYSKDVTDEGLSVLGKLPNLKRIMLNELTAVTGEFLDHFAEDCPLESLRLVSLKGLDGSKLKSLSRLKNLRSLSIDGGQQFNDETLREVDLSPSIKDLEITGGEVGDETVLRWLSQVDLERLTIRTRVSRAIVPGLAKQTRLTVLQLSNMPLLDEDFAFLKHCDKLSSLQISGMPLRGDLLDHISNPEKVTLLELENTLFVDDQIQKLSKFKSLQILSLAWTPISGEGLVVAESLPTPWSFNLYGVRMTEAGKRAFANWKGLKMVGMPSNWSLEDNQRFRDGYAPQNPSYNAHLVRPSKPGEGPPRQTYAPAIRMGAIDNCPVELMAPVAELQAQGLADNEKFMRQGKQP